MASTVDDLQLPDSPLRSSEEADCQSCGGGGETVTARCQNLSDQETMTVTVVVKRRKRKSYYSNECAKSCKFRHKKRQKLSSKTSNFDHFQFLGEQKSQRQSDRCKNFSTKYLRLNSFMGELHVL